MADEVEGEVGGRGVSEGELEDGEVLSSEGEEEGEVDKEEDAQKDSEKCEKVTTPPAVIVGSKRPSEDDAADTPQPKAPKVDSSPCNKSPQHTTTTTAAAAENSDAEEGEIFSDDEEAAYFPQRIKSREPAGVASKNNSDFTDEKRAGLSRGGRRSSVSPERDSQRSRRQRSRDRGKDEEPKSLATLFFEDRDGTPSELSDEGREGWGGRRKGDQHSSPGGSRSGRDRERLSGRERRGGEGRGYYRSKDTHQHNYHHHRNSRDREWEQESNVESSEEETTASWSSPRGPYRSSPTKGYHHQHQHSYHQRGGGRNRGGYSKYGGQKHDGFGGRAGDTRGRENSKWGRTTAQDLRAQAENVRKRREKGLPLLQTPKVKPSDNLDQFNYPATPSWYLEALERWEKEREGEGEGVGRDNGGGNETVDPNQQPQSGVTAPSIATEYNLQPQPLFPPSTQFILPPQLPTQQPQQGAPTVPNVVPMVVGGPPQVFPPPLVPLGQLPPISLQPPIHIPSLFPPPPLPVSLALPPLSVPPMAFSNPPPQAPGPMAMIVNVAPHTQLVLPQQAVAAPASGAVVEKGGVMAVIVGREGGSGTAGTVSTVRVSSLALDVSNKSPDNRPRMEEEEDEEEEGGMKIALETPTPQPATAEAKTFSFLAPAESQTAAQPVTDTPIVQNEGAPLLTSNDEVKKSEKEGDIVAAVSGEAEEKGGEENMEIDDACSTEEVTAPTQSEATLTLNGEPNQPISTTASSSSSPAIPDTTTIATSAVKTTADTTNVANSAAILGVAGAEIRTYSPPPMALIEAPPTNSEAPPPTQTSLPGVLAVGAGGSKLPPEESELEEEDYDKYLDQLYEEEEEERGGGGREGKKGREVSSSALVSAISASLLQNNPLDEEFPAIAGGDERSEEKGRESLKSLLVAEGALEYNNDRGSSSTRGKGSKSARRRQKQSEWWNKQRTNNNSRTHQPPPPPPPPKPPCKFYLNGFCKQGEGCLFSHAVTRPRKRERCKFYIQDSCTKGDACLYYHGEFPCKFFHTVSGCKNADSCKFSHAPLTSDTRELLFQVLDPPRKALHPSLPTLPPFTTGTSLTHDTPAPESHANTNYSLTGSYFTTVPGLRDPNRPLLISIPTQVLSKSLVVSIPRQKLGPPFGTVPIHPPPSAPTNQSLVPNTHPHHSGPQQVLPGPQSGNIRPPPPIPHPGGTNTFLPPPPHGQTGANFPQPLVPHLPPPGWLTGQPIPLFPPSGGPPVPTGLPPLPPQFPPPPSGDRKCLLPTPPSHLRLDPKNILWSEDDKPEYWEASAEFGQQPPPSGSFGPPPLHVPQGTGDATQQQQPHHEQPLSSFGNPGQQQGALPPSIMDPRQNRMESRPGTSMDPRHNRGGSANTHQVPGPNVGGINTAPPYQPLPGYQGPLPLWPHLPKQAPPPGLHPPHQFPGSAPHHTPSSTHQSGHTEIRPPPPQSSGLPPPPHQVGGPGTFGNPAPSSLFQHPHQPLPANLFPNPQISWGPSNLNPSPPSSSSPGPLGRVQGGGADLRPARVDPRTKYSHLKIKSKGSSSTTSSGVGGTGGILKGRESEGGGDRTHMPKLLQEPPTLDRPIDPRELFDGETSGEVGSEYQVSGPFGSSFGSFFARSSSSLAAAEAGTDGTGGLPYGEITMAGMIERENSENSNKLSGTQERDTTGAAASEGDRDAGEGEGKSNSVKSGAAAVPSYLAELGVESDLTIDSAFSSLKGEEGGGEEGEREEGDEVKAKKLPSIFGFGAGTSSL